ncbi:UNVERIFIED_CONTAM: hypothetical protein FKN15_066105 [Acipenser sinensis]
MEKPEFDFKACPDCEAWVRKEEDKKQPVKPGEMEESRGEASSSSSSSSSALESLGATLQQLSRVEDSWDPDIPADASLLYELQLLEVRERPSLQSLSASDCIRIGSQKRERGNYYFQREEYQDAFQSYSTALQVLSAPTSATPTPEHEELRGGRVKCLNNLAAVHIKLERYDDALETSSSVLELDPDNVKALFRKGKLLSDKGEFQEAMETLKKALKLEPSTKAIHLELSKLVKKQTGDNETPKRKPKPTQNLGESLAPFPKPLKKNPSGIPWELLLAAIVVAVGTLVTSMILSARN